VVVNEEAREEFIKELMGSANINDLTGEEILAPKRIKLKRFMNFTSKKLTEKLIIM
jgi:hypothetical protein